MDMPARAFLWKSLRIDETYDQAEVPPIQSEDATDLLWDTLLEESREDGNLPSFFLVTESNGNRPQSLYVSPDWPSAESYAQSILGGA